MRRQAQILARRPDLDVVELHGNVDTRLKRLKSRKTLDAIVLHRVGDKTIPVVAGRYLAEHIPGAKYVELPGDDHLLQAFEPEVLDRLIDEMEEFMTGARHRPEPDRLLVTVMFTDIVGSTERAAELGDRRWRETLEGYLTTVRRELERFRGREIDTAGDGVFATFDGPARAIRCACAIRDEVRRLGLEVRIGLHTGECEVIGAKVGGIAVHTGARVAGMARAQEILVSGTVKDLVAGSGIGFEDRGGQVLKGVPGEWRLFAVTPV